MEDYEQQNLLYFWHGARRWSNPPELKSPRKSRYEHGAGIYLTNSVDRAIEYSKNGGQIVLCGVDRNVGLLDKLSLPIDQILEGIELLPRVRNRHTIKMFLQGVSEERFFDGNVPLSFLLNELITSENLSGRNGMMFSQWLVSKGVDAAVQSISHDESYVVVFNPKVIVTSKIFDKKTAQHIGSFEPIDQQLGMRLSSARLD